MEEHNFYLIMGTDKINEISTWKDISYTFRDMPFYNGQSFPPIPTNGF